VNQDPTAFEARLAKIAALVRERDLLLIDRALTSEEAAELATVEAFSTRLKTTALGPPLSGKLLGR